MACPDPGCADVETVVLVMRPGQGTWAFKIPLPMSEVEEGDIRAALPVPSA